MFHNILAPRSKIKQCSLAILSNATGRGNELAGAALNVVREREDNVYLDTFVNFLAFKFDDTHRFGLDGDEAIILH